MTGQLPAIHPNFCLTNLSKYLLSTHQSSCQAIDHNLSSERKAALSNKRLVSWISDCHPDFAYQNYLKQPNICWFYFPIQFFFPQHCYQVLLLHLSEFSKAGFNKKKEFYILYDINYIFLFQLTALDPDCINKLCNIYFSSWEESEPFFHICLLFCHMFG